MDQEYETLAPAVIEKPYLMVTFIPCYLDGNDTIWLAMLGRYSYSGVQLGSQQ